MCRAFKPHADGRRQTCVARSGYTRIFCVKWGARLWRLHRGRVFIGSHPTLKNSLPFTLASEELLKRTTSRCPVCHRACPAEVWRASGSPAKVFLKRTCEEHGEFSACIASDARFYWLAKGNPDNACCSTPSGMGDPSAVNGNGTCCSANGQLAGTLGRNAEGHGDAPFEKLSTCLALIEIVRSCNLTCPTCYADSPVGVGKQLDAVPLDELKTRIQGVIDRKGDIEILQLSGG